MNNAIYLTTTEPFSGKSIYALGVMNLLASKTDKLAYFKPIITGSKKEKDQAACTHCICIYILPVCNVFLLGK